ncbi:MAG: 50S ribosomal protein L6 [bacterium]|nr:50S ribosomal protein L6 [bacterium]
MSRIGKKPVILPNNVELKVQDGFIWTKGPKGELKRPLDSRVEVKVEEGQVFVTLKEERNDLSAIWGLYRSLIANMIKGVEVGFERILTFQGVGFKAVATGSTIELNLGFSHPIKYEAPQEITFKVEKNKIVVSGIDKELVGHVASSIRNFKKPEPYKGSGIKYAEEVIIKKAGKKAATTAS